MKVIFFESGCGFWNISLHEISFKEDCIICEGKEQSIFPCLINKEDVRNRHKEKKARETKARIEVISFGHILFEQQLSVFTLLDMFFFLESWKQSKFN